MVLFIGSPSRIIFVIPDVVFFEEDVSSSDFVIITSLIYTTFFSIKQSLQMVQ